MHRTLLAAALLPLALGDYSFSYDAPTMAPTISAAPTRTDTYYPSYTYITLQHATRNKHRTLTPERPSYDRDSCIVHLLHPAH